MTDFPEKQGWDQLFAVNVKWVDCHRPLTFNYRRNLTCNDRGMFYLTSFLTPLLEKAANGNFDPAKGIGRKVA